MMKKSPVVSVEEQPVILEKSFLVIDPDTRTAVNTVMPPVAAGKSPGNDTGASAMGAYGFS